MAKKVYLVYDYEEFCGVYSSLGIAKRAVEGHLGLVRKFAQERAEKHELGGLDFELQKTAGERTWVYSLSVKSKNNGLDVHCRRPIIFECPLDEYDSMTKRMVEQKKNKQI